MQHDPTVRAEPHDPRTGFLLKVRCLARGTKLSTWMRERRALVERSLHAHGVILFRDFDVATQADFEAVVDEIAPRMTYTYRSTPRTAVGENVYTATEYPRQATIPLHCENAYQRDWPMKLLLHCARAAQRGGETTVASSIAVTERLGEALVDEMARRQVMYIRNYGAAVDLSWETVFQTDQRAEVERYCRENGIEVEWKSDGGLRTRQVCQGVATHPITGQRVWFNQAHLFHVSSLDPETRASMLSLFKVEDLPRMSCFGDGAPIPEPVLEQVREAYKKEAIPVAWRAGDVVLVDNMLAAHGRLPFTGARRVLVALAEPFSELSGRAR